MSESGLGLSHQEKRPVKPRTASKVFRLLGFPLRWGASILHTAWGRLVNNLHRHFPVVLAAVLFGVVVPEVDVEQSVGQVQDQSLDVTLHVDGHMLGQRDEPRVAFSKVHFQHGVGTLVDDVQNGSNSIATRAIHSSPALDFMKIELAFRQGRHVGEGKPHVLAGKAFGLVFGVDVGQAHHKAILVDLDGFYGIRDEDALLRNPERGDVHVRALVIHVHPKHHFTFEAEGLGDFAQKETLILVHVARSS